MGYVERRLFLMPEYFEDIATERLIKEGIKPDQLNKYVVGECLDAIAAYRPNRLFTGIALEMLFKTRTGTLRLHYDTTSINVTGEQFRNALATKNATIRDQYKKPTRKPSAKCLYFLFRRVRQIDKIADNNRVCRILNDTSELVDIIHLVGPPVEKYYSV